ncbi:ferrichrome ABC transporter permease [Devosia geojensis]|uniref:Ferrichrome ABC transporter permease n=1 Tax=Devosia geojensis TaxID=443610 RepID=A0A0F5FTM7_9HYPH|nr:iron ABC transporter permease [Devosia geojensis]KKB11940.1 ferrichrome ABC transporter permease [Devosia geojensis]
MTSLAPARHVILRSPRERIALRLPVRALVVIGLLVLALLALSAVSLATGSYGVSLNELVETLRGITISRAIDNVVWEFRFPRTLAAALVGAMMALSGAALQTVTRNGLADPSLVGVSQGAALAVVAVMVLFPQLGPIYRPWLAFGGSILVAVLIQWLSHTREGSNAIRFILMGLGVSAFISSITSALMTYGEIDRALSALAWLAGSINAATWGDVLTLAGWSAVLLPALLVMSRAMAAMRMGEAAAIGLGAPVQLVRPALVTVAVGLAAIATSVVGPLGFVGLIAPHAARRLAHAGMGFHLVLTALIGALLVGAADLIGRAAFALIQIPAGLLTALIGVPIFIVLLARAQVRPQ